MDLGFLRILMRVKTFIYYISYISLHIGTIVLVKLVEEMPDWFLYFPVIGLTVLVLSTMFKFIERGIDNGQL